MTYVLARAARRLARWRRARAKRAWRRAHPPAGACQPVFLAGCYRSGTTMTAQALERSLEVDFYSDADRAAFHRWYLRDFPTIHHLLARSRATVAVFQTNNELYRLPGLLRQFPEARAVVVVRHFADVVSSTLRNEWRHVKGQVVFNLKLFERLFDDPASRECLGWLGRDLFAPPARLDPGRWTPHTNPARMLETRAGEAVTYAAHWLLCAHLARRFVATEGSRVLLLRYEQIVRDPAAQIARLCRFLGIGYGPSLIRDIHGDSVSKSPPPALPPALADACQQAHDSLSETPSGAAPGDAWS